MKPNYQKYDPRGWCGDPQRGAALGRPTIIEVEKKFAGRVYLSRIKLIDFDYDVNGTYFGGGPPPLYWCALHDAEEGKDIDFMLRAETREDAKRQVLKLLPNVRFFR